MMFRHVPSTAIALSLLLLGAGAVEAQQARPLAPPRTTGQGVAPYLEGWYANPDGTYTFSFGYFNFNTEEQLDIPVGPDNRIEPAQFDGMQPTHFMAGPGRDDRRHRGVFAITVPADWGDGEKQVIWTIRRGEQEYSVPGYVTAPALQLGFRGAMGSVAPPLRLDPNGPEAQGVTGLTDSEMRTVPVGEPLQLWAAASEISERLPNDDVNVDIEVTLTWYKHQGPGEVTFTRPEGEVSSGEESTPDTSVDTGDDDEEEEEGPPPPNVVELGIGGGEGTVLASFDEPGDYILRVRADNFGAQDSSLGNQCCWTNGYVHVEVTP